MRQVSQAASELAATPGELGNFLFLDRLLPNLVAAAASLLSFNHGHGLPVNVGHRHHGGPGFRVLAVRLLLDLRLMALRAGFGRRDLGLGDVGDGFVLVAWPASQPTTCQNSLEMSP